MTVWIPWAEQISKEKVLKKVVTEGTLILRIRMKLLMFLGDIVGLRELDLTGHIEGKKDRRQQATDLMSLYEWSAKQVQVGLGNRETLLKATGYRKLWRALIYHIPKGTWHIEEKIEILINTAERAIHAFLHNLDIGRDQCVILAFGRTISFNCAYIFGENAANKWGMPGSGYFDSAAAPPSLQQRENVMHGIHMKNSIWRD